MSSPPERLPAQPTIPVAIQRQIAADYERFGDQGLPGPLEDYLSEQYGIDVSSTYGGVPIRNPWGKASGQLSMTLRQVEEDVEAGLGFIVLKTVIAKDASGGQSMAAWAIPEARMVVETITSATGESGWTVTWKGRGWSRSLGDYLDLVREATRLGRSAGTLVVPSCKYHLPATQAEPWRVGEYEYTTGLLLEACAHEPMVLEKDFSPTLAGSERAREEALIADWLHHVPILIRAAAAGRPLLLGIKVFNALFDDDFQVRMLQLLHQPGPARPDYLVYGNRLFDPQREFEGLRGVAYGGPDLSDRNLRVLDQFRTQCFGLQPLEISGTGNIGTGKMALEYALRGCHSFQLHTFFQLPQDTYRARTGSRTQKALHGLLFHPEHGFVVWLLHLAQNWDLRGTDGRIQFARLPRAALRRAQA